jgi:hypothetical protein
MVVKSHLANHHPGHAAALAAPFMYLKDRPIENRKILCDWTMGNQDQMNTLAIHRG